MKKKVFSLMMTLLLAFVGVARADELTVHDGTATNAYVPVYGFYGDAYLKCEMVYPASELSEMNGGTISALTFYASSPAADAWTSTWQVFVSEVSSATISAFAGPGTVVYEGALDGTGATMTINFSTPYQYNGGNLLVGVYNITTGNYKSVTWAGETVTGASVQGYSYSSLSAITATQRNFLPKTTFNYTVGGGSGSFEDQLHVKYVNADGEEVIDSLNLGTRPANAWMAPFEFTMYSEGPTYTVNVLDFTPSDGMFTVEGEELPFQVTSANDVDLVMSTNATEAGIVERQFVAITEGNRAAHIWPVVVEMYAPECPDVVEVAYDFGTIAPGFTYDDDPAEITPTTLHNDYTLPFPEIEEGEDAVYMFTVEEDVIISAHVNEDADNGKVALYTEDFYGEGGPMATNNYTGLTLGGGGGAAGAPFEAQIGEGTTTTGYFPFYTLYNYSISENLFLATELAEAGVTTAPMTSLSWYATNAPGYAQQGITIWMANVDDEALTTTSHIVTNMTKVYTGAMTPAIGWNEFVFNEGTFSWDGHSNVLIFCQRNNGTWNSTVQWQATSGMNFNCMAYRYQDSGAYDPTIANTMYTSTIRPNIIMKAAGGRANTAEPTMAGVSAGPVIENLPLTPGTYYLVASAKLSDDLTGGGAGMGNDDGNRDLDHYTVYINVDEMPCPAIDAEGFAFNPEPADDADEIEPNSVTLRWMVPEYATGWRLIFGSTYYPDPNHPQTIMYPEDGSFTTQMANSYTVRNLWNNTNYFWHVEFNNDGCPDGVSSPTWGFTTHLNVPQNLTVVDETVFNDEEVVLNWNAVVDRTYRFYNVYRDGVCIGHTDVNNISNTTYTDGPLAYNMDGYVYYVTAVYDEGESAPSNTVNVKVSGYGDVNGHVYEQDGTTGIAGATVTMVGQDEFGDNHTYNFTTNAQGYYSGQLCAGHAYDGQAAKDGYQTAYEPVQGEPIDITYNNTTSPIDYKLDENFDPVCQVIAEYYPDSLDPNSPYVKVYWGCGLPGSEIIEDFETGDFSMFDWQLDNNYPWSITTTNPYEGTYCMKSGGAGVANVVSNMSVTVEIPNDGIMSFFAKISCENSWDYGYFYIDGVQKGSFTGAGNWVEKTYDITAGEHTFKWSYTKDSSVNSNDDCFYVDYITFYKQPEPPIPGMTYDFEDGTMQGWTSVDADGDGYGWYMGSEIMTGQTGNNGSNDFVLSQSYYMGAVLYPDNYLVSPQVQLGGVVRFYACAQDASYAAEHFGLAVSTTNTNPSSFTMVQEWTMTAKGGDINGKPVKGSRSGRAQGTWYEYTVDLSAYSGMGYVAIRHFNCSDMFYLNVDDITIGEPGAKSVAETRSLDHYRVYRTNCYNDGPYTEENTVLLATVWVPDTVYIDVEWADLEPGVYKWGVGSVYSGNRDLQLERESEIVWSNCLDKDMYLNGVTVNVLLNSADSPEGTTVNFTNLNEYEQQNFGGYNLTLDESGFYAFESFRRGDYAIKVELDGYETINDTVSIWSDTDLRYVMTEILYGVGNVYVSRTGWAMWDGTYDPNNGGNGGGGNYPTSFSEDFEGGFANWTLIDADGDGLNWYHSSQSQTYACYDYTGWGHNETDGFAVSSSYTDCTYDSFDPNNFLITNQKYSITASSVLNFWADYGNDSYPDHFGVAVATVDNPTANDFTMVWEGSAKNGNAGKSQIRHNDNRYFNWRSHSVDLSAYAGQDVYIAFRHFNSYDQYEIYIDDVELTAGAKSDERHFEYYKVMCTSIDGVPIYNHNTVWPFCQLSTDEPYNAPLVEGETYLCKVAVMYSTGMSEWSEPVAWVYEPCDHWGPVDEVTATTLTQGNHIEWVFEHGYNPYDPGTGGGGQGGTASTFTTGFEGGLPEGWTVIDGNNDGYTWCATSAIPTTWTYYASLTLDWYHSGTDAMCSGSYINGVGAITPDEYLVSPQVTLVNGSQLSFWVAACDASYPADHFGVFVSDNGTSNWTSVQEWTLTAKKSGVAGGRASRDGEGLRLGTWYNYTVDLSAYAGQKYIAFRHFNCNDQYIMCLDDVELTAGSKGYNAMNSGMIGDVYAFNITDIANFDERVYFLYKLVNDNRFNVIQGEAAGMFIISANNANLDLEEAVNEFVYNNNIEFGQMDKVQAANTANTYKAALPAGFTNSLMMDMYIQSRENNLCELGAPFCTDEGMYEFPAGVNAGSGEAGPDYDCLYTTPNPAWYYMKISDPGDMDIYMYSTPSVDIDFCCWGPFDDPFSPCPYGLTEDKVVSCSYSANPTEHCMIPATAQTGEYYILVITNYSNQPCNINFSKIAGSGTTDCTIVIPTVDLIGFLITQDGEYLAFVGPDVREYTDLNEFGDHEYCVRPIYPGEMILPDHNYGWSMGCPVCASPNGQITCEPGAPIHAEELHATDQVKIWWGEEPVPPMEDWIYYDNGVYSDAIGTGGSTVYWAAMFPANSIAAYAGTNLTKVAMYEDPELNMQTITTYVYLGGSNAPGTLVSTQTFNPTGSEGFHEVALNTPVGIDGTQNLWIVFSEYGTYPATGCVSTGDPNGRWISIDGVEWEDVASYGLDYTWMIRGFVTNMAKGGMVENIALAPITPAPVETSNMTLGRSGRVDSTPADLSFMNRSEIVTYNVYRSDDNVDYALVGTVPAVEGQNYYEYIDTPAAAGTYYYQVKAEYGNGCESEGAPAFDNPDQDFVTAEVTGLGENDGNVALYPNPTSGNVTIEAAGMSRITVVSVLGQVVFDTELNANNYTLNMAQFNAGMYMVRVYSENGVTVKRVTVMK